MRAPHAIRLGLGLATVALAIVGAAACAAACVVGTGAGASCTELALNACLPGGVSFDGTVTFNCGGPATIVVTSTKIIDADTTIDGAGLVTVSGGNAVEVFFNANRTFTVQRLTIANGNDVDGGGIYNDSGTVRLTNSTVSGNRATHGGGGIYNAGGTLTVTDSSFDHNSAAGASGIYNAGGTLTVTNSTFDHNSANLGGGIISDGTLTVTNSAFDDNSADLGAGSIYNSGTLTVTNSTFDHNSANLGGGIISDGTLTASNNTFTDNRAANAGGAIYNLGTLTVSNSTFSGNSADEFGAGGGAIANGGTLTVSNSTFDHNSAPGGGGGIRNEPFGALAVANSTFDHNDANQGGGIWNEAFAALTVTNSTFDHNGANQGGGILTCDTLTITNTIVANSVSGGDCVTQCDAISNGGHNLIEDVGSTCGLTDGVNGNLVGVDPMLDPEGLQGNGGPTQTIAILDGSPAIGAGDPEVCANPPVSGRDQRGYVRPGTGSVVCSIGAYEYHSPGPCVGDCDGSGDVTDEDRVTLLSVALGTSDLGECSDGDWTGDGAVTVDEIILAVNATPDVCAVVAPEQRCLASGGAVTTRMCCLSTGDFPNTCGLGACTCAPGNSHQVLVCVCGENRCWDGSTCSESGPR
jgi:predicted outer membrane repeat protein